MSTNKRTLRPFLTWSLLTASAVVLLAWAAYAYVPTRVFFTDRYEDISYRVHPSPQLALAYGERHFDPTDPAEYDIARAEYFFQAAAEADPKLPYVYHDLARISFLRSQYATAFAQINFQISLHGDSEPAAYYVRGLIEGFMGDYLPAAADYQHFLQFDPNNWAAKNDEAWVLLKAGEYQEALQVVNSGLVDYSANAWLLNSKATALYELGDYKDALAAAQQASVSVAYLTPKDWSVAYPGNDPAIAGEGLDAFRTAVTDNIQMIQSALASSTVSAK